MTVEVNPVPENKPTFAGLPRCDNLEAIDADVVIIGIPYKSGYEISLKGILGPELTEEALRAAPDAVRLQSVMYAHGLDRYDFDFGGDLFAGKKVRVVDCGNLVLSPGKVEKNLRTITAAVRTILDRGAIPFIIGGDHGTPAPILQAYENYGPICVVQIDAHIDFIDERNGVREGFSSQMRRAAEMDWVSSMIQIGLRGIGSAGQDEVDAAHSYGSIFVRAEDLHRKGVEAVLKLLPDAESYYITIDADGLDPSIAPGVYYPSPGGVDYFEITNLIKGIAGRGKIVGLDFDEVVPPLDVRNLTSITAARVLLNSIGALAHGGHIGG